MSSRFKLPALGSKRCYSAPSLNAFPGLNTFDYDKLDKVVEIGRGSFAVVFSAIYNNSATLGETVVVKKMLDLEDDEKDLFLKEVKLLNTLKHPNIVTFHGVSISPPAIMLEYMYFDFSLFDRDHKVHSLKEFLHELSDAEPNTFAHVIPVIASDVAKGLSFLHDNGVVHRDLKPANVLVSNHHYRDLVDMTLIEKTWTEIPVVCKLTDFGEARSQLINTRNFKETGGTRNVSRGTPAFMAPEVLLLKKEQPTAMSLDQLKKVDIWALGLVYFCVLNPALSSPYTNEFRVNGVLPGNHLHHVRGMMKRKQLPSTLPEFEQFQGTTWKNIFAAFERCVAFDSNKRPTASEVLRMLASHGKRDSEEEVLLENKSPKAEATRKDALKVNEGDKIAVECNDTPISPPGVCGPKKRPRSEEQDDFQQVNGPRQKREKRTNAMDDPEARKSASHYERECQEQNMSGRQKDKPVAEAVKATTSKSSVQENGIHDNFVTVENVVHPSSKDINLVLDAKFTKHSLSEDVVLNSSGEYMDSGKNKVPAKLPLPIDLWSSQSVLGDLSWGHHDVFQENSAPSDDVACSPTDVPSVSIELPSTSALADTPFYNNDKELPIFNTGKKARHTIPEAAEILLKNTTTQKCTKTPLRVRRNMSFLVDISKNRRWEDIKSDMNSAYTHHLRTGIWTVDVSDDMEVKILEKRKVALEVEGQFHIHINSKRNAFGLSRSIFFLSNQDGDILHNTCLLQYHIDKENCNEVVFDVAPHGNRKNGDKPFYPTQKSTMQAIKEELSVKPVSGVFKMVASSAGGILGARQPEQLPRSKQQLYDIKSKMRRSVDEVEELLLYSKSMDDPIVLEHHDLPEDLWVLGKQHMCNDLSRFCCSEVMSYPLSVDPTFNFGRFEVTPYSYKHLLLKSRRTNETPVFLGPTAIHYSKTKPVFKKIANAVATNSPGLSEKCRGFITDGEKALHDALSETMRKSTGLRCFNHFRRNCKEKLNALGIRKQQEQKVFLDTVFEEEGVLGAEDKTDLKARIQSCKQTLEEEEKQLTSTSSPQFWTYISSHEKMMKKSMIATARRKAGMADLDNKGKPARCFTNQSESVNNKLTRQKEAMTKSDKNKSDMSKLQFVKDVWQEVDRQQQFEMQMGLCGLSEEYELSEMASYLQVNAEDWFEWSEKRRAEYVLKFNKLTIEDVMKEKPIVVAARRDVEDQEVYEWKEFSDDIKALFDIEGLSVDLMKGIVKEAENLLNTRDAIQRMPSLDVGGICKYLVASSSCRKKMYECTVYRDHVTCNCPCYKFNTLCKHSLCVAENSKLLNVHIEYFRKTSRRLKPSKSGLVVPEKVAPGKKGGANRNSWRPSHGKASASTASYSKSQSASFPFREIHHNDRPLKACFLSEEPKAKECRHCRTEFPRRTMIVPFNLVLSHEEKWLYPDPNNAGNKLPSAKYTTKHYCIRRNCIMIRFPYFNSTYLEIPEEVRVNLKEAHKKLIQEELDLSC